VESEFRIECEECDNITIVLVESGDFPEFCPICGRRANSEDISELNI
jgi:ribosomal protein S27E